MTKQRDTTPAAGGTPVERPVGRLETERDAGGERLDFDAEMTMHLALLDLSIRESARLMPLVHALLWFEEWARQPPPPSARQIRWSASYWREHDRAEAEFAAAFPHWKTPNARLCGPQRP